MKKLLLVALGLGIVAAVLAYWLAPGPSRHHLAAVPVVRKHQPEAPKHVWRVPALPHHPPPY